MGTRRLSVGVAAAALVVAACGSTPDQQVASEAPASVADSGQPQPASPAVSDVGDESARTETVSDLDDVPVTELPPSISAMTTVDIGRTWTRGCLLWDLTVSRDHGAINDAVYSFLVSEPGVLARRLHDRELLNGIVSRACNEPDVTAAWVVLAAELELSNADFEALIDASCRSFRSRNEARDPQHRPDVVGWDGFVLEAVGLGDLWDPIDELCDGSELSDAREGP